MYIRESLRQLCSYLQYSGLLEMTSLGANLFDGESTEQRVTRCDLCDSVQQGNRELQTFWVSLWQS